jgi:hypothetical protein
MQTRPRVFLSVFFCVCLIGFGALKVQSQNLVATEEKKTSAPERSSRTDAERITALEEMIKQQSTQLDELRQLLVEQQQTINMLAGKLSPAGSSPAPTAIGNNDSTIASADPQAQPVEDRLKKIETRVSELGSIKFSGDLRLRSESFFGLQNNLTNADNPAILGNELSPRHRMRIRARLSMRGTIRDEFEWGIRLATGSFADNISTNQTLTDFFNRKPFALDQAFLIYKPKKLPGLRLQGGRFEPPWLFTEMVFDNDLMVDGFNESYSRGFKNSMVKELTFAAWQLPMLERNSAFVRNSNGTINIEQSHRDGRDLALYGGTLRARLEPNPKVALTLSVADHYFYGTQFITPVQVFGSQLQIPVTVTIPATPTTPAQTVTSLVLIPRDLLVAGNGNLGLTNASNNAVNRDGHFASGFNLIDVLGRLDLKYSKRFPVSLIFDFVTNTQTHDVIRAGPGGVDEFLPNDEKNGFWGEIQVGSTRERGDYQLDYTFMHIAKDAVLTPFNFSDITQQSDARVHRFIFSYAADARVLFTVTGIVTKRLNGLFGPFVPTPPGSLDRATTRFQFDTIFRF